MKKVLIISYPFPPRISTGAQRPYGLAKYLPIFGWQPVVLTVKRPGNLPNGIRVISTDCPDIIGAIKKTLFRLDADKSIHEHLGVKISKNHGDGCRRGSIVNAVREIITFPDDANGWYYYGVKSASELLEHEHFDAMISTSDPVTSHLIGKRLKEKFGIKWIADLRDLWTQNHYYDKSKLIKYFEKKLELRTLSCADALVTVSEPLVEVLKLFHKRENIFCITNGYDSDDFGAIQTRLSGKFTITYTGALYNGKRDPALLFQTVSRLIEEKRITRDHLEIRFYGYRESWLDDEINKYNLQGTVSVFGHITRQEALQKQKESQLLLLLLWNNQCEEGVYTGKVFEYLGAKRPILAIGGPGGVVKKLLETTNSGRFAEDASAVRSILLQYYKEFVETGTVGCKSNSTVENYSYRSITGRYSELLNKVILK